MMETASLLFLSMVSTLPLTSVSFVYYMDANCCDEQNIFHPLLA